MVLSRTSRFSALGKTSLKLPSKGGLIFWMKSLHASRFIVLCFCAWYLGLMPYVKSPITGLHSVGAAPPSELGCFSGKAFYDSWIKVGERVCVKCHVPKGDAGASNFLLSDDRNSVQSGSMNCEAFTRMALEIEEDGRSRLLIKATGGLDHGGGVVVHTESTEFRILQEFVRSVSGTQNQPAEGRPYVDDLSNYFDGVEMLSDQRLLRRITLSLAARLPSDQERQEVASKGLDGIGTVLDSVMKEEAFYRRLKEGFNDIFLTLGYNGNGEDALSYNHFEHTRHWYQTHDLNHVPEQDRQKARYKIADQYREALRGEPMDLLCYIVRNERPFCEILTADYTMVSPYTARGYGIFEDLKDQFKNPDDPFEFIPAKLKALKHRDGQLQPTSNGVYPHAGLLSMFQYLRRYPTTETNRNRLRARMYYQHFLGIDIMSVAPRVGDAAAIDAKYSIPTMQAAECVVCHRIIDPVAGLFQDYYNEEGHYGPRKDGWFVDIFSPGREGVPLLDSDRWRSLQWLGENTVKDPRFAIAMTEHVYYIMMGRKVILPPSDIESPGFEGKRLAFLAQREWIQKAATRFMESNFSLKVVFHELIVSPFYRADGLSLLGRSYELANDAQFSDRSIVRNARLAELDDIGLVRLLSPEQIERKIVAVFGKPWGRLDESYAILYGGIDSQEVTERLSVPSGAIGALQRILANDVACKNVAADFARPASERRLFPRIEIDVVPKAGDQISEQKIRETIVHLHQHILGREDANDSAEVEDTYTLYTEILREAAGASRVEPRESYFCKSGQDPDPRDPDPHYTLRSWRAVVTYLLRQREFLYE